MRLRYFPANAAWAFTFGTGGPTRMGDSDLFLRSRREAIAAARRQGLKVSKDNKVTTADHHDKYKGTGESVVTFKDVQLAKKLGRLGE